MTALLAYLTITATMVCCLGYLWWVTRRRNR